MRGNGPRKGSRKENHFVEYEGGRMTRNGISANHLLNFSLPERERERHVPHAKKKKSTPMRTQMEYLHANYRFVVSPNVDDTAVACWDIETLTEWKSVEQVLLWYDESSPATCPICLDEFQAPKITRCGHIFCWPCILRYLSMTDKYWRRCPMCFDSVQKGQLRSVCMEQVQLPPREDTNVSFRFLERSKASLFPQHRDLDRFSAIATRKRVRKLPSVYDTDAKYSRILESTKEYLLQLAMDEMRALEAMDADCRSCGDIDTLPFVEEAMKATSGRLASIDNLSASVATAEDGDCSGSASRPPVSALSSSDVYSFYQLENGNYVVLHPLNVKCLMKEYSDRQALQNANDTPEVQQDAIGIAWNGGTDSVPAGAPLARDILPETVSGRIVEVEHLVMDDEALKRYRFLGHLPKFCDFYVCEIDLSSEVSKKTLDAFRSEIKRREKQRRVKRDGQDKKNKKNHASTSTAASPVFHQYAFAEFSLEQDGQHWPAPAELSLSDSFQEGLDLNSSSTDTAPAHSNRIGAASAVSSGTSPPPEYPYAIYDEASFASITRDSGYFQSLASDEYYPPLAGGPAVSSREAASPSPSSWGTSTGATNQAGPSPSEPTGASKGKKKGGMKKGTPLFSTTQRRSYR